MSAQKTVGHGGEETRGVMKVVMWPRATSMMVTVEQTVSGTVQAQVLKLEWETRMLMLVENSMAIVAKRPDARGATTNVTAILELKRQWVVFILINTVKDTPTAESTLRGPVMTEITVATMAHGKEELKSPWGVWLAGTSVERQDGTVN